MKDGILIIDKPEDMTSARTVSKIKDILKVKKSGHVGTLDPFATGMLIVSLNRATKISQYLSDLDKVYVATMVLGISTDTQDLKGRILRIRPVNPAQINQPEISKIFSNFVGEVWQVPPMFSAVRYKGVRLYKFARKGIKVNLSPRKIKINYLDVIRINHARYPSITLQVHCSKGTYIRALCHDIGECLGCGAYVSSLRRIGVGDYTIEQAIGFDRFLSAPLTEKYQCIVPVKEVLNHLNQLILFEDRKIIERVKNGGFFSELEVNKKRCNAVCEKFTVYSSKGDLLAIAKRVEKPMSNHKIYKVEKVLT